MAYAVMCCGCRRFMNWLGKADIPFSEDTWQLAADYPTIEVADKDAVKHGWLSDEGNHRCPECRKAYEQKTLVQRRAEPQGAIVWLDKPSDING